MFELTLLKSFSLERQQEEDNKQPEGMVCLVIAALYYLILRTCVGGAGLWERGLDRSLHPDHTLSIFF